MAKVSVPIEEIMNNPDLSITDNAFGSGMVIKRASYPAGETPEHLERFSFDQGECANLTGTVVYKGKKIPATAACRAENA